MVLKASTWSILTLTSIYILQSSVSAQGTSKISSDDTKVLEDKIVNNDQKSFQDDKDIQDVLKPAIENPTICLIITSCLCTLFVYLLIKYITSKPDLKSLEAAMVTKQSVISKLESETKSIEKEIDILQKKLEEKDEEEKQLDLEENELKIKTEEKEKDDTRKKELDAKLTEYSGRLDELKEKRNEQGKLNKSMKDELFRLEQQRKSLEDDMVEKEAELASSREDVLKDALRKITDDHSKMLHCREKASESLEQLRESIEKLTSEKERLKSSDERNLLWIEHYSVENNILDQSLRKLKSFEDKLNSNDGGDDDDDEVQNKLKMFADKSLVEDNVRCGEDELESLRHVLVSDQDNNKHVEDEVRKAKSDLNLLLESYKLAEKDSKVASIRLDIVKEKERDVMLKLEKLGQKDYHDDCQTSEEKINQHLLLAQEYKNQAEVLKKEVEMDEHKFRQKVAHLEKMANDDFVKYRKTEKDAQGLQQEIDALSAQLSETKEELDKAEAKHKGSMAAKIRHPVPMMPFPRPPFLPPIPNFHMFRPLPNPESNSMRSTPYNQSERPYGPSPINRPFRENSNNSASGPRKQAPNHP